jgi:arginase family enzyme
MPEPGGPTLPQMERQLGSIRASGSVVGAGFTGLAPDPQNVEKLERLAAALGF